MRSSISVMPSEKRLVSTAAARLSCQEVSIKGLNKLGFGGLFGPIFVEEGLGMALVGGLVLVGQDDGVAS